jgi:hypothetical protein
MPTRKNRIISLRLSEEEYENLKSVYASRGIRSLSEFARDAMHRVVGGYPSSDGANIEHRVELLHGKVAMLEGEVSRLSRAVGLEAEARKTQ